LARLLDDRNEVAPTARAFEAFGNVKLADVEQMRV